MAVDQIGQVDCGDIVRSYYRMVDAGDVEGLVGLFDDDAVYHRPGYEPLIGKAALLQFYNGERVIADGRHTVSTMLVSTGEVAVHGSFHGALRDGAQVDLRFADFFVFGGASTIVRRDTFFFAPMI
jgi:steroid Delta-isomerase